MIFPLPEVEVVTRENVEAAIGKTSQAHAAIKEWLSG
jgi:hypothetical protein